MHSRLACVLTAFVALFCVLALCATCAAWFLLDAPLTLSFLDKVFGAELLLVCGSVFLVLGMVTFSVYVLRRSATSA